MVFTKGLVMVEVRGGPHEVFRPREGGLTRIRCFRVVVASCRVVMGPGPATARAHGPSPGPAHGPNLGPWAPFGAHVRYS